MHGCNMRQFINSKIRLPAVYKTTTPFRKMKQP
jgi:hypothetical protein